MNSLRAILSIAKKNNWCTQLYCTTCGSRDFRKAIGKYSRNELIDELKCLGDDEMLLHRDAIILCFYDASIFRNGRDLEEPLNGTPGGELLKSIFAHKANLIKVREKNEQEKEARRLAKLERVRLKASKDIGNAIRRKDFAAIEALIAKGANLDQVDEFGISLSEKLQQIK